MTFLKENLCLTHLCHTCERAGVAVFMISSSSFTYKCRVDVSTDSDPDRRPACASENTVTKTRTMATTEVDVGAKWHTV